MRIKINDVTTTPEHPLTFLTDIRPYPEKNIAGQKALHPELKPLELALAPAAAFERIKKAIQEKTEWQIVGEDKHLNKIQCVAITKLLRFRDDLVIEVRQAPKGASVHMRSKSRLGRTDFGANAKRIMGFFSLLK